MAPRWWQRLCFKLRGCNAAGALSQRRLDGEMRQVASLRRSWQSSAVRVVKFLQKSVRNQGEVELVEFIDTGRFVAVKRMPNTWAGDGPEAFERMHPQSSEKPWVDVGFLRLLEGVGFPYVCRFHGIFRTRDETLVATSFCPEGDLFAWCNRDALPAPGARREQAMKPILAQVVDAVRWLHDLGIAHRDLSLENILLEKRCNDLEVKLIDFGMATFKRHARNELVGKNSYQAPELHGDKSVDTFLADSFSLGMVFFAMAAGTYPWATTRPGECQLFTAAAQVGVRRFIGDRPVHHRGGRSPACQVLSADLLNAAGSLLELRPWARASVGEAAFYEEVRRGQRRSVVQARFLSSVWDGRRLRQLAELPPTPKGVGATTSSSTVSSGGSSSTRASGWSACLSQP